jgi:hypothetical protein
MSYDDTETAIYRRHRSQTEGLGLFDVAVRPSVRSSDPQTSHEAWQRIKPKSARAKLLLAHFQNPAGLTDPEAAQLAGLSMTSEYATRCSELTAMGLLRSTDESRVSETGASRLVRVITERGLTAARSLTTL